MQKCETKQLMTILQNAYPSTYRNMSDEEMREALTFWHDMFGEYDIVIVATATKNYVRSNKYPPTVAGLQEQINLILPGESTAELWNKIKKACRNSAYNAIEEFERLPDVCQRWAGGPSGLRDLSAVEPKVFDTVVRGEFLKSIQELKSRTEVQMSLPPAVRAAIEDGRVRMIEQTNNAYEY